MKSVSRIILSALKEDLGHKGDITTDLLIPKKHKSTFALILNENCTLCGIGIFKEVFKALDKNLIIKPRFKDGQLISKGKTLATVYGNTRSILKAERTALNFIGHLSGIATCTSRLVNKTKGLKVTLLDTRKTTPNLRTLEKYAVLCGGAKNHRFNLSEMILIKDNHIKAAGGIGNAVKKARRKISKKTKIEVEVSNLKELHEAVSVKPDIIMFDNWNPQGLKNSLRLLTSTSILVFFEIFLLAFFTALPIPPAAFI